MYIHSLDFDDFCEEEYYLIGIHTTLEDYKLAYLLNKQLKTNLTKEVYSLDFETEKKNASFSVFSYTNYTYDFDWFLISNSYKSERKIQLSQLLLSSEIKTYLIPEKKGVDFFIKIIGNSDTMFISRTIDQIKEINQVITSYKIDHKTLKSKDFLIF